MSAPASYWLGVDLEHWDASMAGSLQTFPVRDLVGWEAESYRQQVAGPGHA